jgi:hypothetical protein
MVEYGIQNEQSDIRAHVSVVNQGIYVFQTKDALAAIKDGRFDRIVKNSQPGVDYDTCEGWIMPITAFGDLRFVHSQCFPWKQYFSCEQTMTTTEKGKSAVLCVCAAMWAGRFPFWIKGKEENNKEVQIQGIDIIVNAQNRIQVKCDWRSGSPNGTGNIYLQKAECNPLKNF